MPYLPDQDELARLEMFGFVRKVAGFYVVVTNRIFESRLYDLFIIWEERMAGSRIHKEGEAVHGVFVRNGRFNI